MAEGRRRIGFSSLRRIPVLAVLFLVCLLPQPGRCASCLKAEKLFEIASGGGVGLRQPADITLRGDRLFVLDDLNGRVVAFSLDGRFLSSTPLPGKGGTPYLGFDLGGDDNIYLASSGTGTVVVVNQKGSLVREFETGEKGGMTEPVDVSVSRGLCIVVDNEEHSVKIFDLQGKESGRWGELGDGPQHFRYPFRVAQDSAGRIIISDSLNSRIKVFTPKGDPLLEFGEFGVTEGTFFRPAGLGLWGEDRVLVSDNYLGSVQLFSLQGRYESTLCAGDGTPVLFRNPVSLAVRGSTLFVLEMGGNRVQAFRIGE